MHDTFKSFKEQHTWVFLKIGDPQVTMGFSTKGSNLDDLGGTPTTDISGNLHI